MTRQTDPLTRITTHFNMDVEDNADVQALSTLLEAQHVSIGVCIYEAVDKEGWEALARAVQGFGTKEKNLHRVFVTLVGLAGVRREDIKAVWDVTSDFMVWRNDEDLSPEGRSQEGQMFVQADDTWEDLEEILDMNEAEFEARYRKDMKEKFGVELDSD